MYPAGQCVALVIWYEVEKTQRQVALAMIHLVHTDFRKTIVTVKDMKKLANEREH
ncbi:hypothetical protein GCM10007415_46000 [Parapedobacter pyrenivorans]|uniref:Uncharacterized protein n=1 Tax=Parapedobacter pyrenivorans TaxID=1305674 RepID=A0A917MFJ9_9SPHI|nr:hypothetical protein GCM10007415_46000 [Parapedobacter pyrenivorans]